MRAASHYEQPAKLLTSGGNPLHRASSSKAEGMGMSAVDIAPDTPVVSQPRRRRPRGSITTPLLLLLPTFALMAYTFVLPLLGFFQYSFYRFRRGRLEDVFTLETYQRFLSDEY